jgi:hypothetical protein
MSTKKGARLVRLAAAQQVADTLNDFRKLSAPERVLWGEVYEVLKCLVPVPARPDSYAAVMEARLPWADRRQLVDLPRARAAFARLAQGAGLRRELPSRTTDRDSVEVTPAIMPTNLRGRVLETLSKCLEGGAWQRLRVCAHCRQWFVDRSNSLTRRFCGAACTARWWTRGRRREAAGAKKRRHRR